MGQEKDKLIALAEIKEILRNYTPREPYVSNVISRIEFILEGLKKL